MKLQLCAQIVTTVTRGRSLEDLLLIDAAKRALQASLQVPTHGVVVHAKDTNAASF